jgi:hypothetical protein
MAARFVGWKDAEARGLRALRVIDARVASHRDGKEFFIEELVEYDSGEQGWRRRMGVGPQGNRFTERYKSLSDAEKGLEQGARLRAMIVEALALIAGMEVPQPTYENLESLYRSRFWMPSAAYLASAWEHEAKARDAARKAQETAILKRRKGQERDERLRREYELIVGKAREKAESRRGWRSIPTCGMSSTKRTWVRACGFPMTGCAGGSGRREPRNGPASGRSPSGHWRLTPSGRTPPTIGDR